MGGQGGSRMMEAGMEVGEGLRYGDFVRVSMGSDFRPGQDGMVVSPPDGDGDLGMVFAYDRHSESVRPASEGVELWNVSELDLGSVDR